MQGSSEHRSVKILSFILKWDIHHLKYEAATLKNMMAGW